MNLIISVIFHMLSNLPFGKWFTCPEINSQHEWTVSLLGSGREVICGGVLISPRHILTVDHCLANTKKVEFVHSKVLKGTHFNVLQKFYLPKSLNKLYATETRQSDEVDIGILEIRPINDVTPIELPKLTDETSDEEVTMNGFGGASDLIPYMNGFGGASDLTPYMNGCFREFKISIMNETECYKKTLKKDTKKPFPYLCSSRSSRPARNGDSGGPIMRKLTNNSWSVVGLVSHGWTNYKLDFFTSVKEFLPWIREVLNMKPFQPNSLGNFSDRYFTWMSVHDHEDQDVQERKKTITAKALQIVFLSGIASYILTATLSIFASVPFITWIDIVYHVILWTFGFGYSP